MFYLVRVQVRVKIFSANQSSIEAIFIYLFLSLRFSFLFFFLFPRFSTALYFCCRTFTISFSFTNSSSSKMNVSPGKWLSQLDYRSTAQHCAQFGLLAASRFLTGNKYCQTKSLKQSHTGLLCTYRSYSDRELTRAPSNFSLRLTQLLYHANLSFKTKEYYTIHMR